MKKGSRIFFALNLSLTLLTNLPAAKADSVTGANSVRDAIGALLADHPTIIETAAEYYTKSGYNRLQDGDYFEAAQQFQFALYANPEYALAYYLLAQSYIGQERIDEACQALEMAKHLNSGYSSIINAELDQLKPEIRAAKRLESEEREVLKRKIEKQKAERDEARRKVQRQKAERIIQKILEVNTEPNQAAQNDIIKLMGNPTSPPSGTYYFIYLHRDHQNNLVAKELKGTLVLESNGLYRWVNNNFDGGTIDNPLLTNITYSELDNGPVGRYQYDMANRSVKFLSGLLAQPGITARYDNNGPDPQLFINFTTQGQPTNLQTQEMSSIVWQGILIDNKALKAKSVHNAINILKRAQREGADEFSLFIPAEAKNLAVTPGVYTVYGLDYLKAKRFLDATKELKAALNLDPNYAPAHFLLGLAYTNLRQFNEARQSLEQAGHLNANYMPEIRVASFLLDDIMWEAKNLVTGSTESFKAPPAGTYVCKQVSFIPAEGYAEEKKGSFLLNSNGTYQWLGDGSIYYYSYDSASKRVKFISGPLAQPGVSATFKADSASPAITIKFNTADSQALKALPIQWVCLYAN